MKNIKLEDRLIFALDVPEVSDAKEIVRELDDSEIGRASCRERV